MYNVGYVTSAFLHLDDCNRYYSLYTLSCLVLHVTCIGYYTQYTIHKMGSVEQTLA